MDIIDIMNKITQKLNEDESCGLCWKFIFGGRQDYLNLAKSDCYDDCCVNIGILNNSYTTGYDRTDDFASKRYNDWNIQMFIGIPSRLDIQFYDEVDPERSGDSKWIKYIYPIQCCIDDLDVTICDTHNCKGGNNTVEIWNWSANMKLNFMDGNFDGWLINTTIREWRSQ